MFEVNNKIVDELLSKSCFVVDYLPEQVPANSNGQFFKVETYLLNHYEQHRIYERFVGVILKAMCYYHIAVEWGEWHDQPTPDFIATTVEEIMCNHSGMLNILFPDEHALLVFEWDCLNLSVYNPNSSMQRLLSSIAQSEGLFWRKSNK